MKATAAAAIVVVTAGLALAACGHPTAAAVSSPTVSPTSTVARQQAHDARQRHAKAKTHRQRGSGRHRTVGHGLLAVHDPGQVTGTLTGPCHTRHNGQLPDPSCTPGAVDPAVTQADIQSTICRAGYTASVRPPESQTEAFKWNVAEVAYAQHDVSGELDHLVPLELGGANDASNLWVEAGSIPNPKDAVEDALNQAVCSGRIKLRAAQDEIARNWITAAANLGISVPAPGRQPASSPSSSPAGASSAWCSASASYNSQYGDWDVYVRSNQADSSVTASSGGYSHTWHTDSSGSADVYLRGPAPGQRIQVAAGSANCSTTAG